MFKTILLAYDGSEHARRAAEVAKAEAEAHGARLIVVHAYEPVPDYLGEPFFEEALRRRLERAEGVLEEARALTGVPKEDALLLEGACRGHPPGGPGGEGRPHRHGHPGAWGFGEPLPGKPEPTGGGRGPLPRPPRPVVAGGTAPCYKVSSGE